jgi:hypothetical protein
MTTPTTTLDLPLATNGLVVGFGAKTQPPRWTVRRSICRSARKASASA